MNLNQVTVPCKDISRAIEFYKQLGLRLIVHTHDYYARFECPDGDNTFSLHQTESKTVGERVWVYFEVANVAEKVTELKEKGIVFETEAEAQPWLWDEARLKDPDGNQLILFHAGENRKSPPWRLFK
ncbi:MAG TPA: VOC family protein [Flavobacteriaceae bacterium]|nr:VOC family protein [Flavobacteriaceae bacterium]MCB9212021.1 VOC family protein [Alteromonas sp.]HPF09885.1 VOC family protein [Flavobacteriaceae bacterium]HQU19982.1 VOC family protein [Flavobacteriaceae bacterium]HQU64032.1 VOC family protein [Flavobacteriaceae bacterium]